MPTIRATVEHRCIQIPAPADMPDGTEVVVRLSALDHSPSLQEDDWDDSPAGIDAWMTWLESLEPLCWTTEETAQLTADRLRQRAWELQHSAAHAEALARQWE